MAIFSNLKSVCISRNVAIMLRRMMKMVNNIFDLIDTKDLPDIISKELRYKQSERDVLARNIIDLLKAANKSLIIDEVIVGLFRGFGVIKKRNQVMTKLYNMSKEKQPKIASVKGKCGCYKLIRNKRS
jgi:hypothetical protein